MKSLSRKNNSYCSHSHSHSISNRNSNSNNQALIVVIVIVASLMSFSSAFVIPTKINKDIISQRTTDRYLLLHTSKSRSKSQLFMSSSIASKKNKKHDFLPPPPEDRLTMSGDVASLFLYSFLDHSVNEAYVEMITNEGLEATKSVDPFGDFTSVGGSAASSSLGSGLPVWFDTVHTLVPPEQITQILNIPDVSYAPALQSAGASSVLLTTCWLLSGYITQAFRFDNTLDCSTHRMLTVTGKTWILCTALMVMLALTSDWFVGTVCGCLETPSLHGLHKADADYIFDSLTVIVTWRTMISLLLGSGGDGSSSNSSGSTKK